MGPKKKKYAHLAKNSAFGVLKRETNRTPAVTSSELGDLSIGFEESFGSVPNTLSATSITSNAETPITGHTTPKSPAPETPKRTARPTLKRTNLKRKLDYAFEDRPMQDIQPQNLITSISPSTKSNPIICLRTPLRVRTYSKRNRTITPRKIEVRTPVREIKKKTFNAREEISPKGRRLITIHSLQKGLNLAAKHGAKCPNSELTIRSEVKHSMASSFSIKCKTCLTSFHMNTDDDMQTLSVNEAAIWAANTHGIGYTALCHAVSVFDMPFMSWKEYNKIEMNFTKELEEAWCKLLKRNGEEERQMALELGQVTSEGIAYTDVFGDGQWSKRCYNQQGSSLSGTAVVIGLLTKKPLFVGIRNKFCYVCKVSPGADHRCFKNWNGSSSAMEKDIILEAFQRSVEMHQLIYKRFVGDGDSSVYLAIKDVYDTSTSSIFEVEKIQCRNHAIRRLNYNLLNLLKSKQYLRPQRKIYEEKACLIGKLCCHAIQLNIENRPVTNATTLRRDLQNIQRHVFGDHTMCSKITCENGEYKIPLKYSADKTTNLKRERLDRHNLDLSSSDIWKAVQELLDRLAGYSVSLMYSLTTNIAESFQSHINKFAQGRRINYCHRGAYNKKAMESTFSFQYGPAWYVEAYRMVKARSPGKYMKKMLETSIRIKKYTTVHLKKGRRRTFVKTSSDKDPPFFSRRKGVGDKFYGDNAQTEDLPKEHVDKLVDSLIAAKSIRTVEEQNIIHLQTVGQYDCPQYIDRKRNMITASIAGRIASLQLTTSNVSVLDTLFEPRDLNHISAIRWGKQHEERAVEKYSKERGVKVEKAGLFVSLESGVLGASPDGLVGDDGIVEVKCPYTQRFQMPTDGIIKTTYCLKNNAGVRKCKGKDKVICSTAVGVQKKIGINQSHAYYAQVVMQLHVTGRNWCDFVVWTQGRVTNGKPVQPEGHIFVDRIHRDDYTLGKWTHMKEKLLKFYKDEFGPEIVDSRFDRNLGYRQPEYRLTKILAAQDKKKKILLDKLRLQAIKENLEDKDEYLLLQKIPNLFKVGHFVGNERSFLTLNKGRWLDDCVLHGYSQLLINKYAPLRTDVALVESFLVYQTITEKGQREWKEIGGFLPAANSFNTMKGTLYIISHNINHWFLITCCFKDQSIKIYDSGSKIPFIDRNIKFEHIAKVTQLLKKAYGILETAWKVTHIDVPQQIGGDDCGVMVAMYVESLLTVGNVKAVDPKDTGDYRLRMAAELLATGDNGQKLLNNGNKVQNILPYLVVRNDYQNKLEALKYEKQKLQIVSKGNSADKVQILEALLTSIQTLREYISEGKNDWKNAIVGMAELKF